MKKIRFNQYSLVVVLLLTASAFGQVTWDYAWNADELPESYLAASVFDYVYYQPGETQVLRDVTQGVYTVETVSDGAVNSNSYIATQEGVFDAAQPSTIQFRFKGDSALSAYIAYFLFRDEGVGSLGINFEPSHRVRDRFDYTLSFVAYQDLQGWSTFRILTNVVGGQLVSADIYYLNGDDDWVLGINVPMHADTNAGYDNMVMGDPGSNWGGKWSQDYFYWTQAAATLDPIIAPVEPEPIKWDWAWNADQYPEDFYAGGVLAYVPYTPPGTSIERSLDNGFYTVHTIPVDPNGTNNANASFHTQAGKFDPTKPATIEMRFKNDDIEARQYYTNSLIMTQIDVGWAGFKFTYAHGSNPYEATDYVTLYRDLDGYSTIRVLTNVSAGQLDSADLYYRDGDGNWLFASRSNVLAITVSRNGFSFGDIGENWSGQWTQDYLYWSNQGATLDDIVTASSNLASDLNSDGTVDLQDFASLNAQWNQTSTPPDPNLPLQ